MRKTMRAARTAAWAGLFVAGSSMMTPGTPLVPPARRAMIDVLAAAGPNPALGDEAQTFDRFVGSWHADFGFRHADGTVSHKPGELHFGWVLDGTAVQDLWISYPSDGQKERNIGTTLRFFDASRKLWHIVFINPRFSYVVSADGKREGDRIVFHGTDADGVPLRWTFSDVTPTSFHWQGEKSHDGGKTWIVEEDHHMTRTQPDTSKSSAALAQLKTLAGTWTAVQDGVPVTETYTVTANGSAVMAETNPKDQPAMITMFTVDGGRVLATHYCVAGNQPQMAAVDPASLDKGLEFTLDRITGLKTPGDWHNTAVTVKLDDADHMTQTWTWAYKGTTGQTIFHYTRKR